MGRDQGDGALVDRVRAKCARETPKPLREDGRTPRAGPDPEVAGCAEECPGNNADAVPLDRASREGPPVAEPSHPGECDQPAGGRDELEPGRGFLEEAREDLPV